MNDKLVILQPMKYYWAYFLLSLIVIIPGSYSLIRYGLSPSIDFTGGTTFVWQGDNLSQVILEERAKELNISLESIAQSGNTWTLATPPLAEGVYQQFKPLEVQELSFATVGPSLGAELIKKTIYGIALAALFILTYVAYRFKNFKFGASAILAMFHDSLVLLGVFSLLGHYYQVKVDTLFVTALLTILSFSVHDTIVVFDRTRENLSKHYSFDFSQVVNDSINQTLIRSINTSVTILLVLITLYIFGGSTISNFVLALIVGIIIGTYSSIFVASTLIVSWHNWSKRLKKKP